MAMRTILCVLDGTPESGAALRVGLDLGRSQEAYVEVLHVELDPQYAVPLAADGMTATMIEEIVETVESEGKRRSDQAQQLYADAVRQSGASEIALDSEGVEGFSVAYRKVRGREHDEVARRGMVFDLIVLAHRHDDSEPPVTPTLETALMESGRPVLVVPRDAGAVVGKRIAVAWRASVPGVHAIIGALPLIKAAEEVKVITVSDEAGDAHPREVTRYLAHHGIRAKSCNVDGAGREAGQAILEEAKKAEADLLVLGAYAHSRLRQFIMGGVTSTVLRSASLPLLLAH